MGDNCEQAYDPCADQPCENGATCERLRDERTAGDDYRCECSPGFEGSTCSVNIDDCLDVTCPEYQQCVDGINTATCSCPAGLQGDTCSEDINECDPDPCQHGGVCSNLEGR